MQKQNKTCWTSHLAECALNATQEVVIPSSNAVGSVNVVDFKAQLLHLLEVVVQHQDLGEDRVQIALDHLCAVQLNEGEQNND